MYGNYLKYLMQSFSSWVCFFSRCEQMTFSGPFPSDAWRSRTSTGPFPPVRSARGLRELLLLHADCLERQLQAALEEVAVLAVHDCPLEWV